nr:NUDIX domain-containing protein [Candidatus Sigynarchaeota archaeon]
MAESLEFIYKKEFWYVSTFLNSKYVDGAKKAKEIEDLVKKIASGITLDDLKRIRGPQADKLKDIVIDMGKNASIECKWVAYIPNFPYQDENTDKDYDTLGYFQIEVEYFKDQPAKKKDVTPLTIQQIPILVLAKLSDYERNEDNKYLNIDTESPIFNFVTSDKTVPVEVSWSQENIVKYKRTLGYWIEVYSGAWPDYNEALYDMRIENNLSNRLSELHFIRRNSGFIYMAEENYKNFFDGYMRQFVLDPTPRIRSMLYALISINHSLDLLFTKISSPHGLIDIEVIEQKLVKLRLLRGMIQTNMSVVYDEIDYNRRQHYTAVLNHLINEFQLDGIIGRIAGKFEVIYNAMNELYQKKNEEAEKKTQKGLGMLNILFGLGIVATLSDLIIKTETAITGSITPNFTDAWINLIVAIIIGVMFAATLLTIMKGKREATKVGAAYTVDAVIVDGKGNVLLQKRAYPPFKGFYAIPGSFIKESENQREAVLRTVENEVGVKIRIEKKIGVFDKKGRDPRGNVISTAYKCTVTGDLEKCRVELVPFSKVKDLNIAFDHKKILDEAGVI